MEAVLDEEEEVRPLSELATLLIYLVEMYSTMSAIPDERIGLRRRTRREFWQTTAILSDDEFRLYFRMSHCNFQNMLCIVREQLSRDSARDA